MVNGLYIAFITRFANDGFHIILDTRETLKIGLDIVLGSLAGNSQIIGQSEVGNSINYSEVDSLGITAVIRCHILCLFNTKDPHGCSRVNVFSMLKGSNQMLVLRNVSQHPQLNLGIIRTEKHAVCPLRHKSLANKAPLLQTNRDILQVRVNRGQAARLGQILNIASVDLAVSHYRLLQSDDISGLKLADLTVFQNLRHNRCNGS